MKNNVIERVIKVANYTIATGNTVRKTDQKFGVSKSTIHKDLTERLEKCSEAKYLQVYEVLQKNKAERHVRGGEATKRFYAELKGGKNIF